MSISTHLSTIQDKHIKLENRIREAVGVAPLGDAEGTTGKE